MSRWLTISEMKIDLISPDPAVRRNIANDPLTYKGRIPLNTSAQVYLASLAARTALDELRCDVLLVHSIDDAIAKVPDRAWWSKHIDLRLFKTLRHNCIDGMVREAALARRAIVQFLQSTR